MDIVLKISSVEGEDLVINAWTNKFYTDVIKRGSSRTRNAFKQLRLRYHLYFKHATFGTIYKRITFFNMTTTLSAQWVILRPNSNGPQEWHPFFRPNTRRILQLGLLKLLKRF